MTCPACFDTPRDPAFDVDSNAWCAIHGARALGSVARMLTYLRSLPPGERLAACSWLVEWGGVQIAEYAMVTGKAEADAPLPFEPRAGEWDRLAEPT